MADTLPITAAEVNKQFVLTKCDYFVDVQLWPYHSVLDPERWLSNFLPAEMEHAVHLLNAFLFFREHLVNQLFRGAFQSLSIHVRRSDEPFLATKTAWNSFLDSVLITHVTGEDPSPTDSGYIFARKARQVLELPEEKILAPAQVLEFLTLHGPRPVVFVDDFVGSGDQFVTTWHRPFSVRGKHESFARIASILRGTEFYYCPVLCTEKGLGAIQTQCPQAFVNPAHVIPSKYSAISPDSVLWPDRLRGTAIDFVRNASLRAGIPDPQWKGYHELGLCVAFEHCIPDASLPLFYWKKNGWNPLFQRT